MERRIDRIPPYQRAVVKGHLASCGIAYADMDKPSIGAVNCWTEIVAGHVPLRGLGEPVKASIRAAGGLPLEFNTIAICAGIPGPRRHALFPAQPGAHRRLAPARGRHPGAAGQPGGAGRRRQAQRRRHRPLPVVVRYEGPRGGPGMRLLALVADGDLIDIDIAAGRLTREVPAAEIARRRAAWQAQVKAAGGFLRWYASSVGPAGGGAVRLRPGCGV